MLLRPASRNLVRVTTAVAGTPIALVAAMDWRSTWTLIATGMAILSPAITVRAIEPDASARNEGQAEPAVSPEPMESKRFSIHLGRGWNVGPTEIFDMVRLQGSYTLLPWLRVGASGDFSTNDHGTLSGCGESHFACGNQLYSFAVVSEAHAFPNLVLDPWVGAAAGMAFLHHHQVGYGYGNQDPAMSTSALPFADLRVGIDFRLPFSSVCPVLGVYAGAGPYLGGVKPLEAALNLNARLGVEF